MEKEEIKPILTMISAVFPTFQTSVEAARIWLSILQAWPTNLVLKATKTYLSTDADFAPTPGKINQLCKQILESEMPAITAWEAWALVECRAKQGYSFEKLCEELIKYPNAIRAAKQVGYDRIRFAIVETELPFVKRNFLDAYDRMKERDKEISTLEIGPGEAKKLLQQLGGVTHELP